MFLDLKAENSSKECPECNRLTRESVLEVLGHCEACEVKIIQGGEKDEE